MSLSWLPHDRVKRLSALEAATRSPNQIVYVAIPESKVTKHSVLLAEEMSELAAEHLGVKPPAIRWFVPWTGDSLKAYGIDYMDCVIQPHGTSMFTFPGVVSGIKSVDDVVYLRPDFPVREIALTAAHEVKHIQQSRHGIALDTEASEADARAYEVTFLAYLDSLPEVYRL